MSDKRGKVFLVQCFYRGFKEVIGILLLHELFGDIKNKEKETDMIAIK